MKRLSLIFVLVSCLLLMAGGAFAQTTAPLTINATVSAAATLALSTNAINFPNADPDVTASIPANENAVTVTVKARTTGGSNVTLTHRAGGDLTSGTDTIAISNVTWTATGTGFVDGTMSSGANVPAGSWTGPGNRSGTFSYFLANSWDYVVGNYTASSTYTLTAP